MYIYAHSFSHTLRLSFSYISIALHRRHITCYRNFDIKCRHFAGCLHSLSSLTREHHFTCAFDGVKSETILLLRLYDSFSSLCYFFCLSSFAEVKIEMKHFFTSNHINMKCFTIQRLTFPHYTYKNFIFYT